MARILMGRLYCGPRAAEILLRKVGCGDVVVHSGDVDVDTDGNTPSDSLLEFFKGHGCEWQWIEWEGVQAGHQRDINHSTSAVLAAVRLFPAENLHWVVVTGMSGSHVGTECSRGYRLWTMAEFERDLKRCWYVERKPCIS